MAKITGKTANGFDYSVEENLKEDMELVDALTEMEEGNGLALSKVCLKLLGREQRKSLYDHLRNESGIVPVDAVGEALRDIFEGMGTAGKN